jgi:hypothetical protein
MHLIYTVVDTINFSTYTIQTNHSHDSPFLGEVRAKEVCFNHQDPVLHHYGRNTRQTCHLKGVVGHYAWHLEFLRDLAEAAGQNRTIIMICPK